MTFPGQREDPWRALCPACIADPGLRLFVSRSAGIERCDFCGEPGPQGMFLKDLFSYMAGCPEAEWRDPARLFPEGDDGQGPLVYGRGSSDLLFDLGEPQTFLRPADEPAPAWKSLAYVLGASIWHLSI